MSPSPIHSPSRFRGNVVAFGLITIWTVIVLRLITVQGFDGARSQRLAVRQRTVVEPLPARPGDIRDREGRLLATSLATRSLAIDPAVIDEPWPVAASLANAVDLDPNELAERIVAASDKRFLWVKRRLTDDEAEAVMALKLPPDVWHFRTEFQRITPQGTAASHVLGTRDIDGHGRGGVEEGLNALLSGQDGKRTLIRDARGYVIDVDAARTIEPEQGRSIQLSLDVVLQISVEERLDALMAECQPEAACAIVLDPRTGEVLAMASRPQIPGMDPESGGEDDEPTSTGWRNHAIASMFEPGSTFKPFIVGLALDRGVVQRDEVFDCEAGAYRMGRRVLHDHHSYGRLSVTDILVKSSNIGMAKIGERLTNQGLFEAAVGFGFGRTTGIELPGELPGLLHPFEKWTSYSTGSIPMGQELSATPLQVAAAHAALANGGKLLAPHLLLAVDGEGQNVTPIVSRQVVSPESARWLVEEPMIEVIARGTGQKAKLKGYTVFGKTGTAQKLDDHGGYSHTRHIGSFVCGAPAHDPRAIVLVAVDESKTGGSQFGGIVAAPAAADMLLAALQYLGVPPEQSPGSAAPPRTANRPTERH